MIMSLVTICHSTELLQYYWLYSQCCTLYPHELFYNWNFVLINSLHLFWQTPIHLLCGNPQFALWIYKSVSALFALGCTLQAYKRLCLLSFKTEERSQSQWQRHQWFGRWVGGWGAYRSEARTWSDTPPRAADGGAGPRWQSLLLGAGTFTSYRENWRQLGSSGCQGNQQRWGCLSKIIGSFCSSFRIFFFLKILIEG